MAQTGKLPVTLASRVYRNLRPRTIIEPTPGTIAMADLGVVIGSQLQIEGVWWCPVLWQGDDEPEFFKSDCLQVKR